MDNLKLIISKVLSIHVSGFEKAKVLSIHVSGFEKVTTE
jgi:hypothetical protein